MSNFVMSIKITDSITNISQEILVCRQSHHGGQHLIMFDQADLYRWSPRIFLRDNTEGRVLKNLPVETKYQHHF